MKERNTELFCATKIFIIIASLLIFLTLIPYYQVAMFVFVMAHDSGSINYFNKTIPLFLLLSIYPIVIVCLLRFNIYYLIKKKTLKSMFGVILLNITIILITAYLGLFSKIIDVL